MGLFLLPLYLVVILLVKEKDLINANYEKNKIKKGYFF